MQDEKRKLRDLINIFLTSAELVPPLHPAPPLPLLLPHFHLLFFRCGTDPAGAAAGGRWWWPGGCVTVLGVEYLTESRVSDQPLGGSGRVHEMFPPITVRVSAPKDPLPTPPTVLRSTSITPRPVCSFVSISLQIENKIRCISSHRHSYTSILFSSRFIVIVNRLSIF